ncbi:MAG: Spx/MgsR family RNA polymerase-binding regulatory protein [Ferruginibacter sp.]
MKPSVILYGIPNCDSIKKTIQYLQRNNIAFEFHNYKKQGIDQKKLKQWCDQLGWERLLNTKGTTWKKLAPTFDGKKLTATLAIRIMLEHQSAIKRPILEIGTQVLVGYDEATFNTFFY